MDEEPASPHHVPHDWDSQRRDGAESAKSRRIARRVRSAIFSNNGFACARKTEITVSQGGDRQPAAQHSDPSAAPDRPELDHVAEDAIESDAIRARASAKSFRR